LSRLTFLVHFDGFLWNKSKNGQFHNARAVLVGRRVIQIDRRLFPWTQSGHFPYRSVTIDPARTLLSLVRVILTNTRSPRASDTVFVKVIVDPAELSTGVGDNADP
jgi:hypothetical protein